MSINSDIEKEIDNLNIASTEKALMKKILSFELEKEDSTKGTKKYTEDYGKMIDTYISENSE